MKRVVDKGFAMGWITVYITGRAGFKDKVLERLDSSWLSGSYDTEKDLLMFWLNDSSGFRDFKKAIGSKIIFKYRLQFFTNLNDHLESEVDKKKRGFSQHEETMVSEMMTWEKSHRKGFDD